MGWKSYFYPQTLARFSTTYNRDIRVVESFGKLKLLVNGSPQSGPYIESLWRHVFRKFGTRIPHPIKRILVMGVGGGTVIEMLANMYPDSEITAVDIDKKIVEIGKKYFFRKNVSNISILIGNAEEVVMKLGEKESPYDLIVVDLFIGKDIPTFVSEEVFLMNVRLLVRYGGAVVVNFLQEREYKALSNSLLDKLTGIFLSVRDTKIFLNRFFFCIKE